MLRNIEMIGQNQRAVRPISAIFGFSPDMQRFEVIGQTGDLGILISLLFPIRKAPVHKIWVINMANVLQRCAHLLCRCSTFWDDSRCFKPDISSLNQILRCLEVRRMLFCIQHRSRVQFRPNELQTMQVKYYIPKKQGRLITSPSGTDFRTTSDENRIAKLTDSRPSTP